MNEHDFDDVLDMGCGSSRGDWVEWITIYLKCTFYFRVVDLQIHLI